MTITRSDGFQTAERTVTVILKKCRQSNNLNNCLLTSIPQNPDYVLAVSTAISTAIYYKLYQFFKMDELRRSLEIHLENTFKTIALS